MRKKKKNLNADIEEMREDMDLTQEAAAASIETPNNVAMYEQIQESHSNKDENSTDSAYRKPNS